MEIISFVQQSKKKSRITFPIRQKSYKSVAYAYTYPSEKHIFKAGRVQSRLTVKDVFAAIGQGLTASGDWFVKNIKAIVISIFIVVGCAGVAAGAIFTANYFLSHTKAISINDEEAFDIASLDKLMAAFALETTEQVDENGIILGESAAVSLSALSQPVEYQNYTVKSGDTISGIAIKFGLKNISTLISVNDIGNVRTLAAGQKLKIPSIDGIVYSVKKGDSLSSIATANNIKLEILLDVNELTSETLT
ncbi:MAG: LysM peptidoglycan-binding domain-containing protein, partial [Treponema sp.]|nr:LysM peptidoglycan-binding domain-containing protein [Treponema sp.]